MKLQRHYCNMELQRHYSNMKFQRHYSESLQWSLCKYILNKIWTSNLRKWYTDWTRGKLMPFKTARRLKSISSLWHTCKKYLNELTDAPKLFQKCYFYTYLIIIKNIFPMPCYLAKWVCDFNFESWEALPVMSCKRHVAISGSIWQDKTNQRKLVES